MRLYEEAATADRSTRQPPSSTPATLVALALAVLVHLTSVAFAIAGVIVAVGNAGNIPLMGLGAGLLLVAYASRPRLGRPPLGLIEGREYPTVGLMCDRVASALGSPPIDGVAVSADFGAAYHTVGWRRRRYVELGAPFLAVLSSRERIATVAHEISHGVNGDPLRGLLMHSAVETLAGWAIAIRPLSLGRLGDRMPLGIVISLVAIPFELALLALSEAILLAAKGMLMLVLRQSQRAEYHADRLAATVAGSLEMQGALEKTYLKGAIDLAVQRHALRSPAEPIARELVRAAAEFSNADFERCRTESRAALWQVDVTHPPTALRVELLGAGPLLLPHEVLSGEEAATLDQEVERLVRSRQDLLIEAKIEAASG